MSLFDETAREAWREFLGLNRPDPERETGEPCVNCGLLWYNETGNNCGHWFCDICLGRGRDEDCCACRDAAALKPPGET